MSQGRQSSPVILDVKEMCGDLAGPKEFMIGSSLANTLKSQVILVAMELPLWLVVTERHSEKEYQITPKSISATTSKPVICLSGKKRRLKSGGSTYHSLKQVSGVKLTWPSDLGSEENSFIREELDSFINHLKLAFTKNALKLPTAGKILSTFKGNGQEPLSNQT